jgi:hypothetical protein
LTAALIHLYAPESIAQILFVTVVLGGGCAWLAGRAIAATWRPIWHVFASMILFAAAVRFLHFALFGGKLLAPVPYAIDAVFVIIVAFTAYRRTRALQMTQQYYWLYEADGPFGWKRRSSAS